MRNCLVGQTIRTSFFPAEQNKSILNGMISGDWSDLPFADDPERVGIARTPLQSTANYQANGKTDRKYDEGE